MVGNVLANRLLRLSVRLHGNFFLRPAKPKFSDLASDRVWIIFQVMYLLLKSKIVRGNALYPLFEHLVLGGFAAELRKCPIVDRHTKHQRKRQNYPDAPPLRPGLSVLLRSTLLVSVDAHSLVRAGRKNLTRRVDTAFRFQGAMQALFCPRFPRRSGPLVPCPKAASASSFHSQR